MGRAAERLDGFTDAAFAFAVTLLVIGGNEAPTTSRALASAVAEVPTFAIGFAIIAMFWLGHVRWRSRRGQGGWISTLLSLLLVFLVLIYVQPLRAMARSLSHFLGSDVPPFVGGIGELFLIYGAGFAAMAAVTAALFLEAQRDPALALPVRRETRGEMFIWIILAATGLASVLFASFGGTERLAPWLYASLPVTIGLFASLYKWNPPEAEEPADS